MFEPGVYAAINRRYVGGSSHGLMTCTVRVLAGSAETAELRPVLARAMAYLIDQFDSDYPYEVGGEALSPRRIAFLLFFSFAAGHAHGQRHPSEAGRRD